MQLRSGVAVAVTRPAAVALIRLLPWEPPNAVGVALKSNIYICIYVCVCVCVCVCIIRRHI